MAYKTFVIDSLQLTAQQKERVKSDLLIEYQVLMQKKNEYDQLALQNDQEMTQAVLSQLHALIGAYAKEEGYDVIISNTSQRV